MTALTAFISTHRVPAYFMTAFAISWGGALLAIGGAGAMEGTKPESDPRFAYALLAMVAGPSLAGIFLTALLDGRAGLRRLASRLMRWRVNASWYAVALLTAPALMVASLLALSLISSSFLPGIVTSPDKATLLIVSLAVGLCAGIFEEIGWTGFAIPALRQRHSLLATGLILGIWWSAWHLLPNVWSARAAAGDLPMAIHATGTAIGVFAGYLTAFRILMVWVHEQTDSVLLAMLMHVSLTASLLTLNPIGISGLNLLIYSFVFAGAVWVLVGVVAARAGHYFERRGLTGRQRAA